MASAWGEAWFRTLRKPIAAFWGAIWVWKSLSGCSSALFFSIHCIEGGRIPPHRGFAYPASALGRCHTVAFVADRAPSVALPLRGPRRSFEGQVYCENPKIGRRFSGEPQHGSLGRPILVTFGRFRPTSVDVHRPWAKFCRTNLADIVAQIWPTPCRIRHHGADCGRFRPKQIYVCPNL